MNHTDIIADRSMLDSSQCYECKSILTTPQTYMLEESETALMLDTDDCGGICLGCLKKKEQQMYEERKIIL